MAGSPPYARPQAVAEDHDRRSADGFFFGGEVTAVQRIDADGREEVGGDGGDIHSLDVAAVAEGAGRADQLPPGGGADRFEGLAALLVVPEVPGRHRRQRLRADAEIDPEVHDPIRLAITERTQQHAVDDGEDRRRGADAESEREDGDGGETGSSSEHPQRVAQILKDGAHQPFISTGTASRLRV